MSGFITLGETMALMRAVSPGSLAVVDEFRLSIGGAESNVAIGIARLGGRASWIGRVGDDSLGERVLRELRAEGVALHATATPGASTGLMVKSAPLPGASAVTYYRDASAGSRLGYADVELARDHIGGADALHVTGITPALSDSAAEAVLHAVDIAAEAGVTVSFDVNHRTALWRDRNPHAMYRMLAARATIVFAGLDEAALMVDGDSAEAHARAIAALGPTQVLIKLGADGCVALLDGELYRTTAFPVDVVDTVGAGDAFVAGYLAELMQGEGHARRLDTASRAGALACMSPGDWESLPRRRDLGLLDSADPVAR